MKITPINQTDGYKVDHRSQYPKGTQYVYSNFTPRSNKHASKGMDEKIVVFGLQYFIKWFLMEEFQKKFFDKPKDEVLAKYKRRIDHYLGEGSVTFEHIEALHDLGYMPIKIMALPEGSLVKPNVPMLVIYNTLDEFFWVTNFLESVMSCMLWKPSTSATTARKYRLLLHKYAKDTSTAESMVGFQGHDFSFRGMSGIQDAAMSGAGHLLSFLGTDSIPAIDFLEDYYNANCEKEVIGCSVPATEHSVMCMGGKETEIETFERLITEVYPSGIVSIVSDTWDFFTVLTEFMPVLKDKILARDGKVVIRPDSGDPVDIICGFNSPNDTPESKGAIQLLWDVFGGTINKKGYKELHPSIGLIYGDSITLERAEAICSRLKEQGFASTNVVLGIGSYTYEYVTRDTHGFAMKATAGLVNNEYREIFKDPKTDDGLKKSAKGILAVLKDKDGEFYLEDQQAEMIDCEFQEVFCDGKLLVDHTLSEIRERMYPSEVH